VTAGFEIDGLATEAGHGPPKKLTPVRFEALVKDQILAAGPSNRSGGATPEIIRQFAARLGPRQSEIGAGEQVHSPQGCKGGTGLVIGRAHRPHSKDPLSGIRGPERQVPGPFVPLKTSPAQPAQTALVQPRPASPAAEQPPAVAGGSSFEIIALDHLFFEIFAGDVIEQGAVVVQDR